MTEIRWHGRGGLGAFTAARLLGNAASIYEGKYALAFPLDRSAVEPRFSHLQELIRAPLQTEARWWSAIAPSCWMIRCLAIR